MTGVNRADATGDWETTLVELIRRAATQLPGDVLAALRRARQAEPDGTRAAGVLDTIVANNGLASAASTPLCQDTGTVTFFFRIPRASDQLALADKARGAVAEATRSGHLRRNTIESLSGASRDDNLAPGSPVLHFEQHDGSSHEAWLLLKGGGCENMSAQYSLPDVRLDAGRDLAGVRACALDAVWRAQGMGCAPGILGVCIGGDRASSMVAAKEQLFRPLSDENPNPLLAELEERLVRECNELFIGPMGFGGKTTLLGVKIGSLHRLPASFFVSVSYICWAARRMSVEIKGESFRVGERCHTASLALLGRMP